MTIIRKCFCFVRYFIYFDFAKAFDTVPHQRLLLKLKGYGIKNEVLHWILAFLMDRYQVVTVNKLGKFDNIKHAHSYKLSNKMLDHVFSEKDLGVIFDSNLSFEEHIFNQVKKENSMVALIKRSFFHLIPNIFCQLYIVHLSDPI